MTKPIPSSPVAQVMKAIAKGQHSARARHVTCPSCGASVDVPPSPSRKAFGRSGGEARRDKLTPERRQQIARDAAVKRWEAARAAKS